jgi:hypothetical protein
MGVQVENGRRRRRFSGWLGNTACIDKSLAPGAHDLTLEPERVRFSPVRGSFRLQMGTAQFRCNSRHAQSEILGKILGTHLRHEIIRAVSAMSHLESLLPMNSVLDMRSFSPLFTNGRASNDVPIACTSTLCIFPPVPTNPIKGFCWPSWAVRFPKRPQQNHPVPPSTMAISSVRERSYARLEERDRRCATGGYDEHASKALSYARRFTARRTSKVISGTY